MKKTFNINISGYVFTIDEDAYELLRNYLDTLHNVFSNETDNAELVADLELRMAELLGVVTEGGAKVITIRNVEELISRMGRPEELVETEEEIHIAPGSGTTEETVRQTVEDMTPPPPPPRAAYLTKRLKTRLPISGKKCSTWNNRSLSGISRDSGKTKWPATRPPQPPEPPRL